MIYVAIGALAVAALAVLTSASALRSLMRQHAREREALLARIMHLAGRTWERPPGEVHEPAEEPNYTWEPELPTPGL